MSAPLETTPPRYGIGAVSRLTGITTHTLRVWERRYQAVIAPRAENGRRWYRPEDVERLMLLKWLVDRSHPISSVANLPLTELQKLAEEFTTHGVTAPVAASQQEYRVAVFGQFLPIRLQRYQDHYPAMKLVAVETNLSRLEAEVRRMAPDVVVLELPIIVDDTRAIIQRLKAVRRSAQIVLVYGYARQKDVDGLQSDVAVALRAPSTVSELHQAIITASSRPAPTPLGPPPRKQAEAAAAEVPVIMEIPARRYTHEQLARLADASTTVECECPKHLADLVRSLTDFELYSQACESRSPEDAALHAYLHATTARARAMIEGGLARVAAAEGLD